MIIVNDASTDNTKDIIFKFTKKDKRISIIHNEQNRGQGFSRNIGIKKSAYNWVAFLDSDDLWSNTKLQTQVEYLVKYNYDLCSTNSFTIDAAGMIISKDNVLVNINKCITGHNFYISIFNKNILSNSAILVKKEILYKAGLYKEIGLNSRRSEDYDFYLRIAKNGVTFCPIHEYLIKHRKHDNNTSKYFWEMRLAELSALKNYENDESISLPIRKKRFITLYYDLVSSLIKENKFHEAKEHVQSG